MIRAPLTIAAVLMAASLPFLPARAERAVSIPPPTRDVPATPSAQTAIFAGGCFWGMEAVFERVKGVRAVTSGYAGGLARTATYTAVSSETTKHAEAVRIVFDPRKVSYGTLLRVYFSIAHDPTQLNRQGPDRGPSYRSAIFPQSEAQREVAEGYIAQLTRAHAWSRPIVTTIERGDFFPAEKYHQNFYNRNPTHPYIVRWDKPKVAAFQAAFPTLAMK